MWKFKYSKIVIIKRKYIRLEAADAEPVMSQVLYLICVLFNLVTINMKCNIEGSTPILSCKKKASTSKYTNTHTYTKNPVGILMKCRNLKMSFNKIEIKDKEIIELNKKRVKMYFIN